MSAAMMPGDLAMQRTTWCEPHRTMWHVKYNDVNAMQ